jgi:hypothetical protein
MATACSMARSSIAASGMKREILCLCQHRPFRFTGISCAWPVSAALKVASERKQLATYLVE